VTPRPLPEADLGELLAVAPSPWERLREATVLVTGASGLIGRWMLSSLLHAVDSLGLATSVMALVRDPGAWKAAAPELAGHPHVIIMEGDLSNIPKPPSRPTHVVHLAAPSPRAQRESPLEAFDTLVSGTRRVLELAAGASPKGFLFCSSCSVYGRHSLRQGRMAEDCLEGPDPLAPPNAAYDEGKRAAETLCGLFALNRGVPAVAARLFPVIGPGQDLGGHHAASSFVRDALAGGPVRVSSEGRAVRSYIYLADAAWWLWTALLDGRPGRAYNVGGGEAVTVLELAKRVAASLSPSPEVLVGGAKEPPSRQVPDTGRARAELGLRARIGLDEAIGRTLAWHRAVGEQQKTASGGVFF
jgi:dTDP-glucose 4,6-dehydratase